MQNQRHFDWANLYSDGTESGTTKYQGTGEGKDGLVTLEAVEMLQSPICTAIGECLLKLSLLNFLMVLPMHG